MNNRPQRLLREKTKRSEKGKHSQPGPGVDAGAVFYSSPVLSSSTTKGQLALQAKFGCLETKHFTKERSDSLCS